MPKKIDEELKARAVRLVNDHQGEYPSLSAAAAVVAKQLGVGKESVSAATRNCPETATRLPAGGHENCPLAVMGSARHDVVCLTALRG